MTGFSLTAQPYDPDAEIIDYDSGVTCDPSDLALPISIDGDEWLTLEQAELAYKHLGMAIEEVRKWRKSHGSEEGLGRV